MVTILPQTKARRQDPPLGIRYLGNTPELLLPSKLHLSANPPQPEAVAGPEKGFRFMDSSNRKSDAIRPLTPYRPTERPTLEIASLRSQ